MAKQKIKWVGDAIDKTPENLAKSFGVDVIQKTPQNTQYWICVGDQKDIDDFISVAFQLKLM